MKWIINPEWLALEGKSHGVMLIPNSIVGINISPEGEITEDIGDDFEDENDESD